MTTERGLYILFFILYTATSTVIFARYGTTAGLIATLAAVFASLFGMFGVYATQAGRSR